MERQGTDQNYDVIVLDAFSGDAIPAHLLTDESSPCTSGTCTRTPRASPTASSSIHISNRYLDLEPVVAAIAKKYGYQTVNVHAPDDGSVGRHRLRLGAGHARTRSS